ncbi:gamma-glutamyltransferase [Luteimonas wenzhouensis]|uniref:Glutathione hydrolase proenzyme n=1 Tax=Luteimonas wenzhouensis TaxID=2599615 RepID=A0A5C5U099_9GAMM|nr:gamma-glutamyltransferase [Luteimonas wenzhouensis]TWT18830.1 gamma-glutamyltransferase [Luteimonas wenzhouensis]
MVRSLASKVAILVSGCLLALSLGAAAQPRQLLNYEAIHKPEVGRSGMVVSQNQAASRAGAEILRQGGNAVDAAVATAFVLAVTLPRAGNIGGDGFMLIYLADEDRYTGIDYRSVAPALAELDAYVDESGNLDGHSAGIRSAGVPGTVAGLALAHQRYGRLPWKRLLEPAIRMAAEGVVLSADEAFALDWGRDRLARSQAGAAVFLHPDGQALRAGERLLQPDLAWTLRRIAEHGAEDFYRGAIAARIDAGMRRHGGLLRMEDLAAYRALEREPLRSTYRDVEVVTMPPASGGGAGIVGTLNILEQFDLAALGAGSADALHLFAEASKLSWRDRLAHVGDTGFISVPLRGLLAKPYAAARAAQIDLDRAAPVETVEAGDPWEHESRDTTHFSVVDADGNAVSNTYTIGADFGSGVMIEGTGFLLGNLIGNFSLRAQLDARNEGREPPPNALQPGRRPISSMAPTMVLREARPWIVGGSPGGNTIPGTVVQTIVNVVDFGMNIAEATMAPRVHQHMSGEGALQVERGLSPDTLRLLQQRGHRIVQDETIGSTQSLLIERDRVEGAADPRRPGAAAVGL